jgi:hypothetical protein
MLVSDIFARVRTQFSDEAGIQLTDAIIMRWINDAMRDIAINNNLLQVRATTPSVVGQDEYGTPTGMLTLHTVRYDGLKLKKISVQEADQTIANGTLSDTPQVFWEEAGNFVLYPVPKAVKTITTIYTRTPVEVAAGGDTPELPIQYHNRIVEYCIAQAAEMDDNPQLASMKMQQFEGKVTQHKDQDFEGNDFYPQISVSERDADLDFYY